MTDQPKLGLNKHTFIPSPPTEAEQMAWSVADSRAQACRQLQQRVDELEREVNSVKELFDQVETHRCLLIETTVELTADLRTAADQCEALSKNLADHKHQLDTMIEENRRLRELLRRVAITAEWDDWGSIGPELLEEIKLAIGRTGE